MMQKIIDDFFNFDAPCPKEIPLCEQVREAYKQEVKKVEGAAGCSNCAKLNVKSRFIEAIWKEAVTSLTHKAS